MKLKLLVFIYFIFLLASSARKVRKFRQNGGENHHEHVLGSRVVDNPTILALKKTVGYNFIWGFMAELSGKGEIIETCVTEIKEVIKGEDDKPPCEEAGTKKASTSSTTMDKIIKYLGIAIDVVCIIKNFILAALTRRFRRFKRLRRLFIQGKSKTQTKRFRATIEFDRILNSANFAKKVRKGFIEFGNGIKTGVNDFGNDVKDKFTNFGHDLGSALDDIGHTTRVGSFLRRSGETIAAGVSLAGEKISEGFVWFKDKVSEAFHKVIEYLKQLKDKILNWINGNKNIKILIAVSKCLIKVGLAFMKVQVTLTKVATLGLTLANPIGYNTLILNFMCGCKLVKKAVEWFMKMTNEEDKIKQSEYFGRFVANIAAAFAGLTS